LEGTDATRQIRQLHGKKSKIPIIAITADAMVEHKKEYLANIGINIFSGYRYC